MAGTDSVAQTEPLPNLRAEASPTLGNDSRAAVEPPSREGRRRRLVAYVSRDQRYARVTRRTVTSGQ